MKLLWISQRVRLDCDTAISFLCTRMEHPDVEYWRKLKRLLCFMNKAIDDKRITRGNYLQEIQTYVDFSHAVHMDMRGHTGGVSTFGKGFLAAKSIKHNMNSISSNESEVTGNSEYLPYNIWYEYFLEAQGYPFKSITLWQDNEASDIMAKNVKNFMFKQV